jgi:hypothetical protein
MTTQLTCAHCGKPISANPIGRWFSRFQCPHCAQALQFDTRTNVLGAVGSAMFFIMAWSLLMGGGDDARNAAIVAGVLWIVLMAVTYALRGVVKA